MHSKKAFFGNKNGSGDKRAATTPYAPYHAKASRLSQTHYTKSGFTLIELSIVLVIIGLIIGGILTGQDLINAASIRAQISQIEKYNTAVRTFQSKYGYLPGDMPPNPATSFGFTSRTGVAGEGDSNGVIQGECGSSGCNCGYCAITGESSLFWSDLGTAGIIEGKYTFTGTAAPVASGAAISNYMPAAKMGLANFIYIWSGGASGGSGNTGDGINYFGLSAVNNLLGGWAFNSIPGLSVLQAYNIDKKTDDGLPQSGNVMAWYTNYSLNNYHPAWASGGNVMGENVSSGPGRTPVLGSAITCYDNNNTSTYPIFSINQNGGGGMNCALSFRFQ